MDYGKWTLTQLQDELRRRGIKISGRKCELVERLAGLDVIQASVPVPPVAIPPPLPAVDWPDATSFRSLDLGTRDHLPGIGKDDIEQYIVHRQANDRGANGDLSAFKEGEKLIKDKVEGLSHSFRSTDSRHFFTGSVEASMKKRLSYNIRFSMDSQGSIMCSSCDCPAGAGPHSTCKHVVAGLLAVWTLKNEGKVHVQQSCTDALQSFHRPKKRSHTSPVKAPSLGKSLAGKEDNDDDPRPLSGRKQQGYQDSVNMLTVNYCNATGRDSSWRFKFGRADIQAAAMDHLYEKVPFTQL